MLSAMAGPATIVWDTDRTVSGNETYRGQNILMQGKLTITGSLTLIGVDLTVDYSHDGPLLILVDDGGSLSVLSSTNIHSTDPDVHYAFQVRPTATLTMNASAVHDCGFEDWENWTASDRGLYIESSNVRITNCTITENCVGIYIDNGSSPFIADNRICKNDESGIMVKGGSSPMIYRNNVSNNVVSLPVYEGAGIWSESASPTIQNNTIGSNIDMVWGLINGIFAFSSVLVISNNTITGHVDPNSWGAGWGISLYSSTATISGNRVLGNDNGVTTMLGSYIIEGNIIGDTAVGGGIGLYDGSGSVAFNNTYRNNVYGVMVGDGSKTTFDNETFERNQNGIDGDAGMDQFDNALTDCIFKNNTLDVSLSAPWGLRAGGTLTLVRPSYDPARVSVTDGSSVLAVEWDFRARVIHLKDSSAAADARVDMVDALGKELDPIMTDADGWTDTMRLEEYRIIGGFRQSRSPYIITATCGNLSAPAARLDLNASRELLIALDDVPPGLWISAPGNDTVTNKTVIEVAGWCEPGSFLKVNGKRIVIEEDGSWSVLVGLPVEGENMILVEAQDGMFNPAMQTVDVIRDTIAPVVHLDGPQDNFWVNATSIRIYGTTSEPKAALAINGMAVVVGPDGKFSAVLNLTEGKNIIQILCHDAANNSFAAVRQGIRDTAAPFLRIVEPADGARTNASLIRVIGQVEAGATLMMNKILFPMTDTGFSNYLELEEGENIFIFTARDGSGNVNTTTLRVEKDSIPPVITVLGPPDGSRFNTTAVTVRGTTEPGAAVALNGKAVSLDNGTFESRVPLVEGANTIAITASDALGNTGQRTVVVILDTTPPDLRILGPANRTLTNQTVLEVSGMAEPGATVVVGGQAVFPNAQGRFSAMVSLDKEGENIVTVSCRDGLFNTAQKTMAIFRDTQAVLDVLSPEDGARTDGGNVTVRGIAEPNSTIRIGGVEVHQAADGSFSASVPLARGSNTVTVSMQDPAGNGKVVELSVERMVRSEKNDGNIVVFIGVMALALTVSGLATGILLRRRA
jgi:parallel beta-helix repeat protein